jgi:hypothetical protein
VILANLRLRVLLRTATVLKGTIQRDAGQRLLTHDAALG